VKPNQFQVDWTGVQDAYRPWVQVRKIISKLLSD